MFEKRKPALLDSLVQAFALAPLFVHMEVMFWCGYRPNLQISVNQVLAPAVVQMVSRFIFCFDGYSRPSPLLPDNPAP